MLTNVENHSERQKSNVHQEPRLQRGTTMTLKISKPADFSLACVDNGYYVPYLWHLYLIISLAFSRSVLENHSSRTHQSEEHSLFLV